MEKYREVLAKYEPAYPKETIKKLAQDWILKSFEKNNTPEVYRFIHSCVDLTSLRATDSKESIWEWVQKTNELEEERPDIKNVAALCVFPNLVATVKEALTDGNVRIAAVAGGFPSAQTFIEIKIAEAALAVADGADEIDMVINLGYLKDKEYEELCEEIVEIKETCKAARLKVILETGALESMQEIKEAAILAMYSGADFIKTSTGKDYPGASIEAVATLCLTSKEYFENHKRKVGIKVSGGVRTKEEALQYYCLVKEILGEEWLTPELFRIGASSLVDKLR